MSITKNTLHIALMCAVSLILFSCDKDVSDVGGSVLKNTSIATEERNNFLIETSNISLDSIQSNNLLGGYLLGTSINKKVGNTKYNTLFRVEPTSSTNFSEIVKANTENAESFVRIKSANIIIPYNYGKISSQPDTMTGEETYKIEGVENEGSALELEVFRSDYNLELVSSSSNSSQRYFASGTDGVNLFGNSIQTNDILSSIVDANPITEEFKIKVAEVVEQVITPLSNSIISDSFEESGKTLRLSLKKDFFGTNLVDPEGKVNNLEIFNSIDFLDNFKGVYLKVKETNKGLVRITNSSTNPTINAKIEVVFEVVKLVDTNEMTVREETIVFNMNQQTVNIVDFDESNAVFNPIFKSKQTALVKGGTSASRIKLFQEDEITSFFNQKPIINQAILKFKVNKDSPMYIQEKVPANLLINRLESGGLVSEGKLSEDETFYDFDITTYLKNLFNRSNEQEAIDSNIDFVVGLSDLGEEETRSTVDIGPSLLILDKNEQKRINIASLQSIKEVPLYGSGATVGNKPQLIIKYTVTK